MPPCRNFRITLKSSAKISRNVVFSRRSCHRIPVPRRFASSSTSVSLPPKTFEDPTSPRFAPLTLLHKTTKLLPRVYNATSGFPRTIETTQLWDSILADAYDDLSATTERPAKVVVYGVDEWSGARDLITALLSDPLSSDKEQNAALNNRWSDPTRQKVEISYGANSDSSLPSLKIPYTYLTQFSVPLEISELGPTPASSSKPDATLSQVLENSAIFKADIPIIVCNPLTTPLSAILSAPLPMNTILVLKSTAQQAHLDAIIQQQRTFSSTSRVPKTKPINIISADPELAVQAIRTLQAEPNSLFAIQRYQDDFVGSQLSMVTRSLKSSLSMEPPLISVRQKMALCRIADALHWSFVKIHQLRNELDKSLIDTSLFKERLEEALAKAEGDKLFLNEVGEAIIKAEKEMKPVMDRLTWWRMTWRVDEISSIVGSSITRTWCHDLEKKLVFHTGRLSALQNEVSQSALSLISGTPTLSTSVLRNSVLQLKSSPNYPLTVDSLTQPILSRRNQLIEYPTTRLHIAGQRAVLGMTGGIISGVGISWAGWLGWLLGTGEGLLGFAGMDAGTAVGVGVLTAVASIRLAVGKWERSKKRWWQDWARVGEALDRDLKASLLDTMHKQVLVMGETACNGMSQSIRAREEQLSEVKTELQELQAGLDDIISRGHKS